MVKVTSVKKFAIILVALLICATVVFAACDNGEFKPVSKPAAGEVDSNGGIAVRYGEWLYYVNGYTSDVSAENTYVDVKDAPRIGSIVRIKLEELGNLFAIAEDEDETEKSDKFAELVRTKAETVVPKIYISNNTSSTQLTGIHIFGDRIYITTPNDALTASGNPRTSELTLMSFKLDGSDRKVHYTFTSNSAEIWLDEVDGKVVATYFTESQLHTLDVANNNDTLVELDVEEQYKDIDGINNVSSLKWDYAGKSAFFINAIGQICKLPIGGTEYTVVVDNDTYEIHSGHIHSDNATKYEIQSVNNGEVYYTKTKSNSTESAQRLYWTNGTATEEQVALDSNNTSAIGWKGGKVIATFSENGYYGIELITKQDNSEKTTILNREYNTNSISNLRVEGDTLYYTADNVAYTIDLVKATSEQGNDEDYLGEAYAKSATSTGWAAADFLNVKTEDGEIHYMFTVANNSISVVKFDVETKKNSETAVALTLLPESDD